MSVEPEKQMFLDAIKKDRYDWTTRKIFIDWLEEHGYDDEAQIHRDWTPEKEKEAEEWLTDLASRCGDTCINYDEVAHSYFAGREVVKRKYESITYEMLVQIGYNYIQQGDYFVQQGSEQARTEAYGETLELFWKYWQVVTDTKLDRDMTGESPFSCTC